MNKPSCYASQPNVISQAENDCGKCHFNGSCISEIKIEQYPTVYAYEQVCKANEEKRAKIESLETAYELAVRAVDKLKLEVKTLKDELQSYIERDAGESI